jgi:hypothetical protein
MNKRGLRLAGLAGLGFVLLLAASVVIEGGRPDTYASDQAIRRFFTEGANQDRAAIAAFLLIPAGCLFFFFLAGLHDALRGDDPASGLLLAAMAGGVWFVAFIVLAKLIDNITGASLAFSDAYRVDPQEARLTAGLAYWVQGASMAGAAPLLAAASLLARRARLIRRPAEIAGYALAVVAPAAVALNGVPILLFVAWIIIAEIALASGRADRPAAGSAPEGGGGR